MEKSTRLLVFNEIPNREIEENIIHIASISFGKDSLAMLLEIIKRRLPLDYVIFCDIRFTDKISGEHPLMAKWIPEAEQILRNKFGIEVIHLRSKKTFIEQFYTTKQRGNHIGDIYGYPYVIGAWCNDRLKMEPINRFINDFIKEGFKVVEYIGIAADEPKRLERYKSLNSENHQYITLADFGITEQQALKICEENNLLSPKYSNSFRGGGVGSVQNKIIMICTGFGMTTLIYSLI